MLEKFKNLFREKLHVVLGIFLLIVVILNVFINDYSVYIDADKLLWYCNLFSFILSFAMIFGNSIFITAVFVTAIPAQGVWIIDFVLELLGVGLGRTAQVFMESGLDAGLSILMHLIVIPISFYGIYKFGFNKKSLKFSLLLILIMVFTTFFFTDVSDNRNCVFYACDAENPGQGYMSYFFLFYLPFWMVIFTVHNFIQVWLFRKYKIGKGLV